MEIRTNHKITHHIPLKKPVHSKTVLWIKLASLIFIGIKDVNVRRNTHIFSWDFVKGIIFTSNKQPNEWHEYFLGMDDLMCSLDRIFDKASIFDIKGESYRGRKTETISLEAGTSKSIK